MLWQTATFSRPSPIEQILEKEAFTLEELLDEDDLIQETKSLNGRLVDFLKQPETVARLVSLVVDPPPDGSAGAAEKAPDGPEARRLFKYPYVACEVFCCEVEAILATLVGDAALLGRLFAILEQPAPLDCVRAGYFSRVLHFLFARRWGEGGGMTNEGSTTNEVMDHLEAHPDLLQQLVAHARTTSVAEVLLRLLGADEAEPSGLAPQRFAWMVHTPVLERLLAQLAPEAPLDAQQNAAHILSALARGRASPLARQLGGPPLLSRLIERALAPDVSILALDICIALLEQRRPPVQCEEGAASGADSPLLSLADEAAARTRAAAVQEVGARLGRLRQVLQAASPPDRRLPTPFGLLAPPLGTARLKAVELVAALVHTGEPTAEAGLAEHGLLALCLALFTQFPFNNLLHHLVTGAICFVLEHGSPTLLAHLLEECRLVPWLVEAPEQVDPPGPAAGRRLRAGYLGHLTHIANRLAEAATVRDAVAAALGATPAWGAWVDGTLRGRNETEDVLTWACGRPSRRAISTVASVDELDDDASNLQQEMEVLESRGGAGERYAGAGGEAQAADGGRGAAGGSFFFTSRNFPSHANDASAAFRLPSAGGAGFGGGDSSSSSSSDEEELQARPAGFGAACAMPTAFRSAPAFDSSSSSSSDDDERAGVPRVAAEGAALGMPGAAVQQRPLAGGRQGSSGSAGSADNERAAELAAEGTIARARSFNDPTDLGWAAFPQAGQAAAASQPPAASQAPDAGEGSWDPFSQAGNGQAGPADGHVNGAR